MSAHATQPADLYVAGKDLHAAATSALHLLELTGHAASPGDTADDLRNAIGNYELAMRNFIVTVKTADGATQYSAVAESSMSAYMHAADQLGDAPCAITVAPGKPTPPPTTPDRAALERARARLKTSMPLDEMLCVPALAATLRAVAMQKPRRQRAPRFDWRKAQANDLD